MYISLNWIKDYVDLEGVDLKKLINQFTLSCAEVEGYEVKGENVKGVITAKITSVENHPNSKKLHLLKLDTGSEILDIVCGAPNVREGMIVPLAVIGSEVSGITIGKATLGGCDSYGMCCSAKELGFSDDNSGLFEFEENTPLGVDIKTILDIDDVVFEVDNKSLTNRPDMWGHYGMAREIAAILGRNLRPLSVWEGEGEGDKLDITVNADTCYRYTSATMKNITKKTSPINMQIRLYYAGMRGINFLADITNYVMLELGQPMHAFDNAIVKSISVDKVEEDTKFMTLDNQERTLPTGTMVIKSNNTPVAVAGVMGGLDSEITDNTNSVLIESACFDGADVRKTAIKLGLRTEASARYEKMLDTNLTMTALRRYIKLILDNDANAEVSSQITDIVKYTYPEVIIDITKDYIDRYIGNVIPEEKVLEILKNLEFIVDKKGEGEYLVKAPSFRTTKDIKGKADLVEEITRVYGYDNIVASSTKQEVVPVKQDKLVDLEYDVKYTLADRYNLSEVHTYIWNDFEFCNMLGINPESHIRIINSLQKDNDKIRSSMLPSLLKVVYDNKNDYAGELGVFEIGRVVTGIKEDGLVDESKSLCVVKSTRGSITDTLLSLKQSVDYLFSNVIKSNVEFVKTDISSELICPVNYYNIVSQNTYLGCIGIVNPKVAKKLDGKLNIAFFEINFSKLNNLNELSYKFEKVSKHMGTELDFNFEIPQNMQYSDVEKIAYSIDTDLVYKVSLTNIFQSVGAEYKNYTMHYSVHALDHTITGEEIESFHKLVIDTYKANGINLKM